MTKSYNLDDDEEKLEAIERAVQIAYDNIKEANKNNDKGYDPDILDREEVVELVCGLIPDWSPYRVALLMETLRAILSMSGAVDVDIEAVKAEVMEKLQALQDDIHKKYGKRIDLRAVEIDKNAEEEDPIAKVFGKGFIKNPQNN